jgi:SAM-dependent methyltransferase
MQQQLGQITWLDGSIADAPPCPACGASEPKRLVLDTANLIAEKQSIPLRLVACPICRTRYWTDLGIFHYEEADGYSWSTRFYVEQGASLDDLIEPIARLPVATIRNCLEIGCGFGFSLDAGHVLFGWRAVGVDPSPLARAGRAALDVDIRPIYADVDTELGGPFDLVYGSEVIEHVATPHEFLKICRAHLAPGGILVLTTPDGDSVRSDVPASILMPILSPGHHLILFSADALRDLARAAGFAFTQIVPRDHGLVLYASDRPLTIDASARLDRGLYRRYLGDLLAQPGRPDDLRTGIRYRLFKDLTNSGLYEAALALFAEVAADCKARFDFELLPSAAAALDHAIRDGALSGTFPAPFCLPGLFFFRGMIAINGSPNPSAAAAWFDAAAQAASAFRAAYQVVGIDDGETGMIDRAARELAILALCHGDPGLAVARLVSLPDRSEAFIETVTLRLLDLGRFEQAGKAAGLSAKPALPAMAAGWEHLVHGRAVEAHAVLAAAAKAGGALGLRARSADLLALASIDPDSAVRLAREPGAETLPLAQLFTRLVDLGHLAQAAALESAVARDDSWSVLGNRGMLALLHGKDPALAAELFIQAVGSAPAEEVWDLKYHALMALIAAAKPVAARRAAQEIRAAGRTVPDTVRNKVETLLRQHPAIKP